MPPAVQVTAIPDPLIATLRERAIQTVGSVVPRGRPLALLDFPRHFNVGDSAIWLGEMRCLAACGVRPSDIRYMCDAMTYDETALRRAIGEDGVILSHGGGNFGDLWESHQRFREAIVTAFPNNAIVTFPQTVHFRNDDALERAARIFNAHRSVTILVRDQPSLQTVATHFRATSHLCPDLAFCLGALARPTKPDRDVVYLARTDQEAKAVPTKEGSRVFDSCDWPKTGADARWRIGDALTRFGLDHPRMERLLPTSLSRLSRAVGYDAMASERLSAGCTLLSRGRVVVTDRLHAHILSLLMGIPSVVLDNSYGKVRRYVEAWTAESPLTHVAESPADAFQLAARLAM